jgi:hypothetical protein
MGIRSTLINMYDIAKRYNKDKSGNHWYLEALSMSGGESLKKLMRGKTSFNMLDKEDKALSMSVCTPISTVIDKVGSMASRGIYYVVDKENNELDSYEEIRNLLSKPNILQSGSQFLKQAEMCIKLFGFCPIYTLRPTKKSIPNQMWIIPPELFHIKPTGKFLKQNKIDEIFERVYVSVNGSDINLDESEYFIIYDSEIIIEKRQEITFRSSTDGLSMPVTIWVNQMIASNTLIVDGGPKGIIHNDDTSEFGNAALTGDETESLNNKFKSRFGLVGKMFSILVTKAKVGWIPLNYDSAQLKLHEEGVRCSNMICNAIGINPNVINSDSKYENQESAERKAYTSLIIPDSKIICDALTSAICPDGVRITLDYSHIECLQTNKKDEAATFASVNNAISSLYNNGLMTKDEARIELAKYFDIDPEKPKGEYKNVENE